ncbi:MULTISPECIES: amidohydrolase [unclassified Arsukibacterium]|uniref:amidohydrolase n=1 Tax=unclassified Arsukibacterium TaxID=2635278 RepID=UPI000C4EFADE|nr:MULTISPECIES: amidohydrolase [unclassified Arsukibacterium]MAA95291.1 N-acyl-L-amino acid amidohydrolase [Rheinheimera sp.]MBM33691.1 N-acyl-L-amino acid amidohydrolase [Rheinheimera sp.]|tara:strand:- start:5108 stop:6427 length:1320 start_codon:yes stop_codon:yes gene_type:complete
MRLSLLSLSVLPFLFTPLVIAEERPELAKNIQNVMPKVIAWRRDIHQHPELSNREFQTAAKVAAHLEKLGLEVRTGIAHTGVVGILKGAKPGPVVALRADMDALPVTEQTGLPFASKVTSEFNGQQTGVMHACGHDAHVAILMGTAEVLSKQQADIAGTIMFIFQPAEEGPPAGEEGGAKMMLAEGLFANPAPSAIFGLHVWPGEPGQLQVKTEGIMAAADSFQITVKGKQVHGSSPWRGIDPINVTGQLINAINLIPARQIDVTKAPAVVSFGQVHGGIRWNIIPDEVKLEGTIRTFDSGMREDLIARMAHTSEHIAKASGAAADFHVHNFAAVTWNDPALTNWAMPSLQWAAADNGVASIKPITGAEDFSFYQQQIPGVFFFLGISPDNTPLSEVPPNHSPMFDVNEDALITGVRALTGLALDYLAAPPQKTAAKPK